MNALLDFCAALARMSFVSAVVIAVICLLRLCLKKAPRKYSYWLWAAAAFRLVCPFSVSSVVSIFNLSSAQTVDWAGPLNRMDYFDSISSQLEQAANRAHAAPTAGASPEKAAAFLLEGLPWDAALQALCLVWLIGAAAMLTIAVVSYVRTRRRVRAAVKLCGNVYECEAIRSPFVLGFFRPRVYIPFGLEGAQRDYVLSHEAYHIKRRDHLVKPLAFLILTAHWFNPLVWLAFRLMSRDMELSCDEKVLSQLSEDARKDYSLSLLSFAENKRFPAPNPLAFGENSVKARVKNVMKYHKAKVWVSVLAAVVCIAAAAACGTNPSVNVSLGIIGSSDGPTSIFVGKSHTPEGLTTAVLFQTREGALKALGLGAEDIEEDSHTQGLLLKGVRCDFFGRGFQTVLVPSRVPEEYREGLEEDGEYIYACQYRLAVTDPSPEDMDYFSTFYDNFCERYGGSSGILSKSIAEDLEGKGATWEDLRDKDRWSSLTKELSPLTLSERRTVPGFEEDYLTASLEMSLAVPDESAGQESYGWSIMLTYQVDGFLFDSNIHTDQGAESRFYEWLTGRLKERESGSPSSNSGSLPEEEAAYTGKHISIGMEELEKAINRRQRAGASLEEAEREAPEYLAWLEILAYRAREKGIAFTDEEYAQTAKAMREEAERASNYQEAMELLLENSGMGEEEYWSGLSSQYGFRREYLGQKFLEELREEFDAGKEENPMANWDMYLKKYREDAVAGEALKMTEKYRERRKEEQARQTFTVTEEGTAREETAESDPSPKNLPAEPPAPTPEVLPKSSQAPDPAPAEG